MTQRVRKTLVRSGVICFALSVSLLTSSRSQQRDPFSRWRPTHELAGVNYVGSTACAQCHAPLTAKPLAKPMTRSLAPVENCEVLQNHPQLNFRNGPYDHEI